MPTNAEAACLSWDRKPSHSAGEKDGRPGTVVPTSRAGFSVSAGGTFSWDDAAVLMVLVFLLGNRVHGSENLGLKQANRHDPKAVTRWRHLTCGKTEPPSTARFK